MEKPDQLIPNQFYHIYNRGNNGENIFFEEKNYHFFLEKYLFYIEPVAETFAYCLMKNHFHLLVRIRTEEEQQKIQTSQVFADKRPDRFPKPVRSDFSSQVSLQFSKLFNSYTKSLNKTYSRNGNLFQRPFKRKLINSPSYFLQLIHYIHFNPQKHGFVPDFREYKYSSYSSLLSDKPTKLNRQLIYEWFQGRKEFIDYHQNKVEEKIIGQFIEDDID